MSALGTTEQITEAAGHEDDHDHPPFLAHHWENPQQQFEAAKLGMWLFLATEFLLFGGLFAWYAVVRFNHPEVFAYGSKSLDTTMGAINTVVLILSSLTMALAVSAAQLGRTRSLIVLLTLTFLGGGIFMGIKYKEYSHKIHERILWGESFYTLPPQWSPVEGEEAHDDAVAGVAAEAPAEEVIDGLVIPRTAVAPPARGPAGLAPAPAADAAHGDDAAHGEDAAHGDDAAHASHGDGHAVPHAIDPDRPPNAHVFFGIYFCMTGLHGIHVLVGMAVIGWLIVKSVLGQFGPAYFTPVDLGGLYWHVVDLIWIFLFPLLYLIH